MPVWIGTTCFAAMSNIRAIACWVGRWATTSSGWHRFESCKSTDRRMCWKTITCSPCVSLSPSSSVRIASDLVKLVAGELGDFERLADLRPPLTIEPAVIRRPRDAECVRFSGDGISRNLFEDFRHRELEPDLEL